MLMNLRDYPRNFIDYYFHEYSDGIIAGSDIFIEDRYFCINKGLIKHNGIIYFLDEVNRIEYFNTNKEMIVKIRFMEMREEKDFKCYESQVVLEDDLEIKDNEMEIGRFKLREGARLRSDYSDFGDFQTEFNTINIINVPYASIGRSTLHPLIVESFANNLINLSRDALDFAFAMECLNTKIVRRILLEKYLIRRLNLEDREYTNLEIYRYMRNIIRELSGVKVIHDKRKTVPKILVD
jgi:hypothetical protein